MNALFQFLKDYSTGKLPYSGFIPMKNARTYHSFMKLYKKYPPKDWFKAEPIKDEGLLHNNLIDKMNATF